MYEPIHNFLHSLALPLALAVLGCLLRSSLLPGSAVPRCKDKEECRCASWREAYSVLYSCLLNCRTSETSGEMHLQEVRDMVTGVVTALAQRETNGPILWQCSFILECIVLLCYPLAATPTIVASPSTCVPKVAAIRCHSPFQVRGSIDAAFRPGIIVWLPACIDSVTSETVGLEVGDVS